MYKPCMPAAFLLAVCNFKGFPALKSRQVLLTAPNSPLLTYWFSTWLYLQACGFLFSVKSSWKYIPVDLLKIFKMLMSLINTHRFFPPSPTLTVVSPVKEIYLSSRCLKYFDRVFVSASSIKLMWWQADSKKRFAPNVLEPHFSSSLSHLKIIFNVITLARACWKDFPPCSQMEDLNLPSFLTDILCQGSLYEQKEILGSEYHWRWDLLISLNMLLQIAKEESLRYLLSSWKSRTSGRFWNSLERFICIY